jgi:hypothetical protein
MQKFTTKRGYIVCYNPNLSYKTKLGLFSIYFKILEVLKNIGEYDNIKHVIKDCVIDKNKLYECLELISLEHDYTKLFNDCIIADLEKSRGNFDKINSCFDIEEFKNLIFHYWESIFINIFTNIFIENYYERNIELKSINFKNISVTDGIAYGSFIQKLKLSISATQDIYFYGVDDYIDKQDIKINEYLFLQAFLIMLDTNIDIYLNILTKITGLKEIELDKIGKYLYYLYICYNDFLAITEESLIFNHKYINIKSFITEETITMNYCDFIDKVILKAKEIENQKD